MGHSKKPRGGISCIIRVNCKQFISKINISQDDVITLTLLGGHRLSSNYIPPVDSSYFNDTMFRTIANEYEPESKDVVVLTRGDINSRVGNRILPPTRCSKYRDNPDKQVNIHGKFVSDICNSFKCYPLNNLTYKGKEFDGKFTFPKADRKSQNDIVIGNLYSLNMISSFTIHELGYNPSDHFPLVVTCNFPSRNNDFMNVAASDLLTEGHSVCVKHKKKINSVNVNWVSYKQIAKYEIDLMQNAVQNLVYEPSQSLLDTNINNLSNALYNSAKSCSTTSTVTVSGKYD